MAEEPFKIEVVKEPVGERASRGRSSGFRWWVPVVLAGVLLGLGVFFWGSDSEPEQPAGPEQRQALPGGEDLSAGENPAVDDVPRESVVADDGQSLWVSPTAGSPLPLNYLPAGAQLLLHLRPSELVEHAEGEKVLAALGPWGETAVAQLALSTGAHLSEIRTLTAAIFLADDGSLQSSLRLELVEPWDESLLVNSLPDGKKKNLGGQTILETSERACYLPTAAAGKLLVTCPQFALDELLSRGDGNALFPRDMQRLLDRTDGDRMATLVFPNKFLQISGKKLIRGAAEPLMAIGLKLLRDDVAAVALSAHWDTNFFLELQSTVNLNQRPHAFALATIKRVGAFPNSMEDGGLAEPSHPYGRKVVGRFPNMLRKLSNYTRGGEVAGITVLRSYLPLPAGHNLLMAAELVMQDFASLGQASAVSPAAGPASMSERLQQTTSLAFPKETLQRALEMLSADIGITIRIAGSDLQLEGITKNQSLALDLRDRPAAEILQAVLLKANPDRTASGPADPKQKLVYLVREALHQTEEVLVTTRSAALKRGDQLPDVFRTNKK